MPLISITRLRLRSWRFVPAFYWYALRSSRQARQARGNLYLALLPDARRTFWTCTVWQDESTMRQYIQADAHGQAMRRLAHWCDEASVVHWVQEAATRPSWQEAHRRMQAEGRPSKVRHPSADHLAWRVAAPVVPAQT